MTIRPIEAPDIPAIANLYERLVRSGSATAPPGLEDAFRRLFIDTPVYSPEIPSLVLEVDGEIVGFQGVQTRHFDLDGTPRLLASLGPVFVIPELRSRAAGAMLIKAAMNGQQDLTISDGASEGSRRLWEHLGGKLAVPQTLEWVLPLQPVKLTARALAQQRDGLRRWSGLAATPIATFVDKMISSRWNKAIEKPSVPLPEALPLTASRLAELSHEIDLGFRLRMLYPQPIARWIFEQLESFTCRGTLVARELRDPRGALGWLIGYSSPDRIFRVMQLQATARSLPRVFAAAVREAVRSNSFAITGRIDGHIMTAVVPYRVRFVTGSRVLVHASERNVLDAVLSLDNSISRIDGEWLMDIRQQPYGAESQSE